MKKVLIAVDDTKGTKAIFSAFNNLIRPAEEVILVHVTRLEGKSLMLDMLSEAELATLREVMQGTERKEELDLKAARLLNNYRNALLEAGVSNVKTVLKDGIPADEIIKLAEKEKVDLIIMGCNGKRGFSRLVSGCTTKDVEKNSRVPVLVAKNGGCEKVYGWKEAEAYASQ